MATNQSDDELVVHRTRIDSYASSSNVPPTTANDYSGVMISNEEDGFFEEGNFLDHDEGGDRRVIVNNGGRDRRGDSDREMSDDRGGGAAVSGRNNRERATVAEDDELMMVATEETIVKAAAPPQPPPPRSLRRREDLPMGGPGDNRGAAAATMAIVDARREESEEIFEDCGDNADNDPDMDTPFSDRFSSVLGGSAYTRGRFSAANSFVDEDAGASRSVGSSHAIHLKCATCNKKFHGLSNSGVRSNYLRHLLVHSGFRPHACSLCPARFTTSANLKRHFDAKHGAKGSTGGNHVDAAPQPPPSSTSTHEYTLSTTDAPLFTKDVCNHGAPQHASVDDDNRSSAAAFGVASRDCLRPSPSTAGSGRPPAAVHVRQQRYEQSDDDDGSDIDEAVATDEVATTSPPPPVAASATACSASTVDGADRPPPIVCSQCHKRFKHPNSLQYHIRQAHSADGRGIGLECPDCMAWLSSRAKLTRHLKRCCPMRNVGDAFFRNRQTGDHFTTTPSAAAQSSVDPLQQRQQRDDVGVMHLDASGTPSAAASPVAATAPSLLFTVGGGAATLLGDNRLQRSDTLIATAAGIVAMAAVNAPYSPTASSSAAVGDGRATRDRPPSGAATDGGMGFQLLSWSSSADGAMPATDAASPSSSSHRGGRKRERMDRVEKALLSGALRETFESSTYDDDGNEGAWDRVTRMGHGGRHMCTAAHCGCTFSLRRNLEAHVARVHGRPVQRLPTDEDDGDDEVPDGDSDRGEMDE